LIIIVLNGTFTPYSIGKAQLNIENNNKEHWVIIICGGADQNSTKGIATPESVRNSSHQVYQSFKKLGYDEQHIFYMHDVNLSVDGVDSLTDKSKVEYAITKWISTNADENDNCCICFVGHGFINKLALWNQTLHDFEIISPDELDLWISSIMCNTLTIVLESCFSGSYIRKLSRDNRIIITSTSTFRFSFSTTLRTQDSYFSYHFFNKLADNASYGSSWEFADREMLRFNYPFHENLSFINLLLNGIFVNLLQKPMIDDNGDGRGSGRNLIPDRLPIRGDGKLALATYPS